MQRWKHMKRHVGRSAAAMVMAYALAGGFGTMNEAAAQSRRNTLERQIYAAFDQGQYARAAQLINTHLEQSPNDPSMLYNLACAQCLLNDVDTAVATLLKALEAGFRDFDHMRRDPDLARLREHPTYREILETADRAAAQRTQNVVDRWRETYGDTNYRYETDETRRISYATALDEVSHREMREMLERQADQLIDSLFGEPPSYYVLVAVPTPDDADRFFKNDRSVGGVYQHHLRRLVARDIGGSLRHEFFHALHFGHMERLGQPHVIWVQEGLACLYEDYEFESDGSIRFMPNDRQLVVKSRARAGRLISWNELFNMKPSAFMDKAPHTYPTSRSIFEFIAAQGKLQEWYRAYVETFQQDRSGTKAFEVAFGRPASEVEREWRKWVIEQPEINLRVRPENAALGIRTSTNGSNDGVLITEVVSGSAAALARLRKGDIIVAIDDRSTRSLMDLRKIIASRNNGDEVHVRVRRNGEYLTATAKLRPVPNG